MPEQMVPLHNGRAPRLPAHVTLSVEPPQDFELELVIMLHRRNGQGPVELEKAVLEGLAQQTCLSIEQATERFGHDPADVELLSQYLAYFGLRVSPQHPLSSLVCVYGRRSQVEQAFHVQLKTVAGRSDKIRTFEGEIHLPPALAERVRWVGGLHTVGYSPKKPTPSGAAKSTSETLDTGASAQGSRYSSDHSSEHSSDHSSSEQAAPPPPTAQAGVPWRSFWASEFAKGYDFPAELDGSGACIGVISMLGSYTAYDLQTYFGAQQLPVPEIVVVGDPQLGTGTDTWTNYETTMDVEVAFSVTPGARHVVYSSSLSANDDITAMDYVRVFMLAVCDVVNRPNVLTVSWGLPEDLLDAWTKPQAELVNESLLCAALVGITVCIASGDSGATYPLANGMFAAPPLVYFPGSSPWVLNCGGTSWNPYSPRTQEVVWNCFSQTMNLEYESGVDPVYISSMLSNLGSSSGGVSHYFPRPAWQAHCEVPLYQYMVFKNWVFSDYRSFQGRGCPDVAANADFLNGYTIFVDRQWRYGGGTSAATPLIAGLMTLLTQGVGRRLGFLNPLLYRLQLDEKLEVFNTIVEGNNGGYSASPLRGWNAATGLGSPHGQRLLEVLRGYFEREKGSDAG